MDYIFDNIPMLFTYTHVILYIVSCYMCVCAFVQV